MKRKHVILISFLLVIAMIFLILQNQNSPKQNLPKQRIVILTVDDVSPAFSIELHQKLFAVLDKHNVTATLFVIPHLTIYNVANPDYAEWSSLIKQEQSKGYEIAQHGYAHSDFEFAMLNYSQAKEKLVAGRALLEQVFGPICGWKAPNWSENYEVVQAVHDLKYCYDANKLAVPYSHAWENDWVTDFVNSQIEFKNQTDANKPFLLGVHVQKMNDEGFAYLDEFIAYALKNNATFKTYYQIYGNK